jgi:hypothetical protein
MCSLGFILIDIFSCSEHFSIATCRDSLDSKGSAVFLLHDDVAFCFWWISRPIIDLHYATILYALLPDLEMEFDWKVEEV